MLNRFNQIEINTSSEELLEQIEEILVNIEKEEFNNTSLKDFQITSNKEAHRVIEIKAKWWNQEIKNHKSILIVEWIRNKYNLSLTQARGLESYCRPEWAKTRGLG